MSHRYLLHISYIGTHFRGLQKNLETQKYNIKSTIQGSIELALLKLRPVHEPKLILSSRTDAGVHALNSTVHVDLQSVSGYPYSASKITSYLNRFFYLENLQIRVNKTEIVPDTFHSRYCAKRRSYLYRLAIAKQEPPVLAEKGTPFIPIEEIDRCYFVGNPKFNTELAHKAAELIKGRHDFRTFMGGDGQNSEQYHPFFALRNIDSIKIESGESACNVFNKPLAEEIYNYLDIHISGRSFLNRQVRRTVAVILSVAQERLTIRDVYEMLTIPSKNSWCPQASTVPAHGLYLLKIEYNEKDKEFPVSEDSCTSDHIVTTENELPKSIKK